VRALDEHEGRVLKEALDFREEFGADCSVDHAVVATEADVHAKAGNDLPVLNDGLFDGSTDTEDGGLWRVDDGVEGFDAPRSEVGDGDGAAVKFVWLELFLASANGHVLDLAGDLEEGFLLGVLHDWGDEAVFYGDGNGNSDVSELNDVVTGV